MGVVSVDVDTWLHSPLASSAVSFLVKMAIDVPFGPCRHCPTPLAPYSPSAGSAAGVLLSPLAASMSPVGAVVFAFGARAPCSFVGMASVTTGRDERV
jgi:hypothetical protein